MRPADVRPSVAFALCGSSNGLASFESFVEHVVRPYGGAPTSAFFSVLKAMSYDGRFLGDDVAAVMRSNLEQFGLPGTRVVLSQDRPARLFADNKVVECAFAQQYRSDHADTVRRGIARWWGTLTTAWDLIASWERNHQSRFDQVLMARADLQYQSTFGPHSLYDTSVAWYTAVDPPNAFWLLERDVAAQALTTIRVVDDCARSVAASRCCANFTLEGVVASFYVPCLWARTLQVRLAPVPELRATFAKHVPLYEVNTSVSTQAWDEQQRRQHLVHLEVAPRRPSSRRRRSGCTPQNPFGQ